MSLDVCDVIHRPKSKTGMIQSHTPSDEASILQERIALASTISALEDQTRDSCYSTAMEDNILPIGAEDMGSGRESFG